MAQRLKTDWYLFITVVVMVFFGAVMIFSASSVMASLRFGSSFYFLIRQIFWIVVARLRDDGAEADGLPEAAASGGGFCQHGPGDDPADCRFLRRSAAASLDPHGAGIGVQPSELAKPALVVFLSFFIAMRSRAINTRYTLFPAAAAVGVVTLAVVVADLGTAVVLVATAATLFFIAGLKWRFFMLALLVALVGSLFAVASKPYRLTRIIGYIDPRLQDGGKDRRRDACRFAGLSEALADHEGHELSIRAGEDRGRFGRPGGPGSDAEQAEGRLSAGIAHRLYLCDCRRRIRAARIGWGADRVRNHFVAGDARDGSACRMILGVTWRSGITTMLVVQAFMNMSVVLGMMPTKGIPCR